MERELWKTNGFEEQMGMEEAAVLGHTAKLEETLLM